MFRIVFQKRDSGALASGPVASSVRCRTGRGTRVAPGGHVALVRSGPPRPLRRASSFATLTVSEGCGMRETSKRSERPRTRLFLCFFMLRLGCGFPEVTSEGQWPSHHVTSGGACALPRGQRGARQPSPPRSYRFPSSSSLSGSRPPTLAPSYIPPPPREETLHTVFEILLQLRFVFSLTLVHLSGHSFIPIRTHAYLFPTLSKNIFLINPVLETELMFTSEMA